jgi:hypothetical protein
MIQNELKYTFLKLKYLIDLEFFTSNYKNIIIGGLYIAVGINCLDHGYTVYLNNLSKLKTK